MANPKVQHWVPRFYLRYFATPETCDTDNPQVWILSKTDGDPHLTNIGRVAAESHLYTPRDAAKNRDWETEKRLGSLESLLADVWTELASGFVDLHGDEPFREMLALFVATLHLRHPEAARTAAQLHSQLVAALEKLPKDEAGNPLISEIEHHGEVRPFDASGYPRYKSANPQSLFVSNIRANAEWLAEMLLEKRWSVVFTEEPVFITTDTPVAMFNQTKETFGIKTAGTVLSIPLSPTRVLFMDDLLDQPKGHYYPLGSHGPAPFNLTAWRGCERFMISPRSTDEVCAEMLTWADAQELSEN